MAVLMAKGNKWLTLIKIGGNFNFSTIFLPHRSSSLVLYLRNISKLNIWANIWTNIWRNIWANIVFTTLRTNCERDQDDIVQI